MSLCRASELLWIEFEETLGNAGTLSLEVGAVKNGLGLGLGPCGLVWRECALQWI